MSMWRFGTGRFVEIDLPAYDVTDTIIKGIYIWLQLIGLVIDNLYTLAFFTACVVRVTCKLLYRVLWLIVYSVHNIRCVCVGVYSYVRYRYSRACFYHSVLRGIFNHDEETWFIIKQIIMWKKAQFKRRSGLIISKIKSIWNNFTSWFHIYDREELIRAELDRGQVVRRRMRERRARRARPWEEALDRGKEKMEEPQIPVLSGHVVKEPPLTSPRVVLPPMYYDVDFYSKHYRQCGDQNTTVSNTCIDWDSHKAESSEEDFKPSITDKLYLALNPEAKRNPPPVFDWSCFSRPPAPPVFLSWRKRFLEYIQDGPVVLELPDSPSDYSLSDSCSSAASRRNSATQVGERISALSSALSALCLSAYDLGDRGYEADNEAIETSCRQLVKMLSQGKLFRAESTTGSSVLTLLSDDDGENSKNPDRLWQKKASSESEMACISYYMKNKGRRQLPVHGKNSGTSVTQGKDHRTSFTQGKDSKTSVTQTMSEGRTQLKQKSGSDQKVAYCSSPAPPSGIDLFDESGEITLRADVQSNADSITEDDDINAGVHTSTILAAYYRFTAPPPRFSNSIYNPGANTPLYMRGLNTQAMNRFLLLNNFVHPADLSLSTKAMPDATEYSDLD